MKITARKIEVITVNFFTVIKLLIGLTNLSIIMKLS